ncbi:MAG TPA: phosphoglucomutase (alpha-D-glucose-1,6-bisphosphate-dependent) [Gemmatimonadales bacterium]|nr:phosphoglucomutase (alpha-D-glucose-1,6-bisphosphate-dependent) [Gemmatimonadales bacterium]
MNIDPRAGQPARPSDLVNVPRLVTTYYAETPDPALPEQRVRFGTSGHRGSSLTGSFNEAHILAITQAICLYRRAHGIDGPLFLGADTHALSEPAITSALEVLAANQVNVLVDARGDYTPTPAISHAILTYNTGKTSGLADGIVVTPSHNPPDEGGFKYNPPSGGPAPSGVTAWIESRANELLGKIDEVRRWPLARARRAPTVRGHDYVGCYVDDLTNVIDLDAVRGARFTFGVDPLGGAGVRYWEALAERARIALAIVSTETDPTFRFMTLDWDGKIRMDCSSPYAMQRLIAVRQQYEVAWACDTDHDRHGIVTRQDGLLSPNEYLAVAIDYLFTHREQWPRDAAVGKTVVTSSLLDRVAARLERRLFETPVGFKWFVEGLGTSTLGFAGEESAGASHLRRNGRVWTTDKDGIVLGLLAAEMTAVTGRDPGALYHELIRDLGEPVYQRIDAPATPREKDVLARLSETDVSTKQLAGAPITRVLTRAPGNNAPIGGVKVITSSGWFAARPSGTEDVYKLYAESFDGPEHLARILAEAQDLVARALRKAQ